VAAEGDDAATEGADVGVRQDDVVQVAGGVYWVRGGLVNWYLLAEGRDLTLVDAGYPGDADDVEASIALIGRRPEDVRAVLVTHAHADHVGAVAPLSAAYGTPVYLDAAEVPHARRERVEQVSVPTVLAHAWRPRVAVWAVRALRRGGTREVRSPAALPFPSGGALDLPGSPVPVPTHGHTSGHTAFSLPAAGVVLTGDALVTGHPTSARRDPQLLPRFFSHDPDRAVTALGALARLDADVVLPGHGGPWRGPVRDAVARALERRTRSRAVRGSR
jgi:glyoxylase-like metal-dependent hydrolase (beta-lactamase superfamily II)